MVNLGYNNVRCGLTERIIIVVIYFF